MPPRKSNTLTEAELRLMKILWRRGESAVTDLVAALPEGEYYESDLLGFAVKDDASGETLGIVRGWQRFGGPPLLEVDCSGREALIPFVAAICRKVDLERRTIEVDLPEGLLEL